MNSTEINFFRGLLETKSVIKSSIPKNILKSDNFKLLINSGILNDEKSGKGRVYFIVKEESYKQWLNKNSNEYDGSINSKFESIIKYRNSKAKKTNQLPFYFLRGNEIVHILNDEILLNYYTDKFGAFLTSSLNFKCEKVCFVENKESFLMAEKIFPDNWIFVHKYGRWGKKDFDGLTANKVIVFGDYDIIGLNEFLLIKEVIKNAEFYIPSDFMEKFNLYSKQNNNLNQKISENLKNASCKKIIEIRELVIKSNRFLEQEALFIS